MIENFRKVAKHPVMKVILGVLVVAFMLSGLSAGFLSQTGDNYIVKVAGEKIYPQHIDNQMRNITRSFAERGLEVDEKMLAALGVSPDQILRDLVQRKLILAEVKENGLTLSDAFLREKIHSAPEFQKDGKFDAEIFTRFLYTKGLREHQYLDELRLETSGEMMMKILFGDIQTPKPIYQLLADRAATKFDIKAVVVPGQYAKLSKEPTEKDLKDFLFENSSLFEVPETREISFVSIAKDSDLQKAHEAAIALEDDIAAGSTLEEIAAKNNAKVEKQTLKKGDDGKLAEVAFSIDNGETSEVNETEDGKYLVVTVDDVTEKHVPELEKIKADVEKEWEIAQKQKLSRKFALDLYEKAKDKNSFADAPEDLKIQSYIQISGPEFLNKGFSLLRGSSPIDAEAGTVFALLETQQNDYALALLSKKQIAKLTDKEEKEYSQSFNQAYVGELQQGYLNYLAAKHGVEFNKNEPK